MSLSDKVKAKLQTLPDKPGVYLMRDRTGKIIYVGKAVSLRNRVRHYFQSATLRSAEPKLRGLINSIDDFEFITVRSDADAVVTEGRMIKEYRPRYNVSFRDDKRFLILKINLNDPWPRFETGRIEKKDGAEYFGPYSNSGSARLALEFIQKKYGIRKCRPREPGPDDHRHCHRDIIAKCSAPCIAKIARDAYIEQCKEACAFLRGERRDVLEELNQEMEAAAARQDFEKAAAIRDMVLMLRRALKERSHGRRDIEMADADAKGGLAELQTALNLPTLPRVIECFDISNISGTNSVASMVCSVNGMPARSRYRRFRIKTVEGSDDPASMAEVVRRRYSRVLAEKLPLPDLVLIDGGVTQLGAARRELATLGLEKLPSAGIAKRFEELHVAENLAVPTVKLPVGSPGIRVVQRLRDEAHRFALTYHRALRNRKIRESLLDEVDGIGEKRKEILLKHFGSVLRLSRASEEEIAAVPGVGPAMAALVKGVLASRAGGKFQSLEKGDGDDVQGLENKGDGEFQ